MEFKDFFSTLKNRISDGYDVPQFFRDLFAMITDVPEEKWGTPQDPATKKTKDASLRSYAKRTLPKKFAQQIAIDLKSKWGSYRLNEVGHYCPFPGCGRTLTKTNAGKSIDSYEVAFIDKEKNTRDIKSSGALSAMLFKSVVDEHKRKLDAYRQARKYDFVSNLVGGVKKYEENLAKIRDLELKLLCKLLIMGIIPSENDGFMLVLFDFALLDEPLLLRPNTLQQSLCRFVRRVLGDELALEGLLEDRLLKALWK